MPKRPKIIYRESAVNEEVFEKFRLPDGQIIDFHGLKSLIFRGGIERSMRPIIWKYMLDFYKPENTDEQNKIVFLFNIFYTNQIFF